MNHQTLYILDPNNYKGFAENTMSIEAGADINTSKVHYCDMTFEQYNQSKGGNLIALTWGEFYMKYHKPHLDSMCGSFEETTKDAFWEGLECVPPKKWTNFEDGEFFFVGECYTADLYRCYVRKGEKYYTALRSIYTDGNDLINLV